MIVGGIILVWMFLEGIRRTFGLTPLWLLFRDWVNRKIGADPDETMCPRCLQTRAITKNWHEDGRLTLICGSCGWEKTKKVQYD